jgi:molybdopterin converting factor subunit 1
LSGDSGRLFYSVGVTIRVLYFAAVREIAGTSEMAIEVPEGATVGNLATILERAVAGLAGRLQAVRWAKNEEFVDLDATLADGDVVALIPPVAGGC